MIRLFIRRTSWGALAVFGYILSPLSWWNDLLVNIPIAYAVANLLYAVNSRLFIPAFIAAYWATNILGMILMHLGIRGSVTDKMPPLNRASILWWLAISIGYTALIAALVHWDILLPVEEYLPVRQ